MAPAPMATSSRGWTERLFAPVDIASLVYFRIMFGGILLVDIIRYFTTGWIPFEYIRLPFHFTYFGFSWVRPLPGNGMYYLFAVLGVAAFFILIGFAYRISAAVFFVGFTYVFLIEESLYLNHYYFVSLVSLLMIFVPAHRKFSVDAKLRPRIAAEFAPAWSLWILRAQIGFVYFFGGVAKINADWLLGYPLRLWLPRTLNLPVVSLFRDQVWLALFFSYSGLCIDLFAVPLLLWRKTRPYMFAILSLFHLTNSSMFEIGIFPWFAAAMTALYFEPDWPRRVVAWAAERLGRKSTGAPPGPIAAQNRFRTATVAALAVYVAIQVLLPLRHWLYPGDVAWTEEGHRFSWRMKLRDKAGAAAFHLSDPETGRTWDIKPRHYLADFQYNEMIARPEMLQQFAHYLSVQATQPGHAPVQVRVETLISLNGRKYQPLVDPNVDLAAASVTLGPEPWITRTSQPRRKAVLRGNPF